MKILLTCPQCGSSEWSERTSSGMFVCFGCGHVEAPENMGAEAQDEKEGKE